MTAEDQNVLFPRKYLDGTEHGASRVIYYILYAKNFSSCFVIGLWSMAVLQTFRNNVWTPSIEHDTFYYSSPFSYLSDIDLRRA